jgi:hypothetical protein
VAGGAQETLTPTVRQGQRSEFAFDARLGNARESTRSWPVCAMAQIGQWRSLSVRNRDRILRLTRVAHRAPHPRFAALIASESH